MFQSEIALHSSKFHLHYALQCFKVVSFIFLFVLDSDTGCSITREQKDMCLGLLRRRDIVDRQGSSLAFGRISTDWRQKASPYCLQRIYIYIHTCI